MADCGVLMVEFYWVLSCRGGAAAISTCLAAELEAGV